ncbi:MAG: L-threonylcarbamoyladenylate synthase [Methanomicrobiales archaeon]
MNLIHINSKKPEENVIETVIDILREGGIIIYPTDTVYGIGANIYNENAIKKVYSIKKRDLNKPLSICVSDIDEIYKIAYTDHNSRKFINKLLPGPYTVILNKKENVPDILTAGSDKIGVRIPDSKICSLISSEFPITTTSANLSGKKVLKSIDEILNEFGEVFDIVIDFGTIKDNKPSTVVDLTCSPPKILRRG